MIAELVVRSCAPLAKGAEWQGVPVPEDCWLVRLGTPRSLTGDFLVGGLWLLLRGPLAGREAARFAVGTLHMLDLGPGGAIVQ